MTSDGRRTGCGFMAMGYHAAILRYSVAPARFPESTSAVISPAIPQCFNEMQINGILILRKLLSGSSAGEDIWQTLVFSIRRLWREALKWMLKKFLP